MVAARELPDSTTELVLYPHTSAKGEPAGALGAACRLRTAYEAIAAAGNADAGTAAAGTAAAGAAAAALVSREKLVGIRNDGSPASQQMVRELLGWR